ncbi:hypothetical protein LWI28_013397 [Acer negundo]|uniref:Uncharacterized protein n=1 Tax=Acer negundo TaxID=4023 RepID=A0AAD5NS17_ACENE|nr:hypothetical protein LWI28_013397 [Acer negundo]
MEPYLVRRLMEMKKGRGSWVNGDEDRSGSWMWVFSWVDGTIQCFRGLKLGIEASDLNRSPYYKFFKWADSNEEIKFQLQEFNNELLNNEKELQKILDDVEKTKNELRKRVDDVKKREMVVSTKEMVLLAKETDLRHGRTLL